MKALLNEVFTAGGLPTHTYIERDHGALTAEFGRRLSERTRIVTVHGPTKSGKTVLVNRVLDGSSLQIDGGSINSAEDFWEGVVYALDKYTTESVDGEHEEAVTTRFDGGIEGGVPGLIKGKAGTGLQKRRSEKQARSSSRSISAKRVSLEAFEQVAVPLVIDDFHYIPSDVRTEIVRALKGPVSRGLAVVLITVAHRVLDAVTAEAEMQGRVCSIEIPQWSKDELRSIGENGFQALNVACERMLLTELVDNTFGSPHLMQAVCRELCLENDVSITGTSCKPLVTYRDSARFFKHALSDGGSVALERLCAGPNKPRKQRRRRSGGTSDVYEAVLEAIRLSGPKMQLTYPEIRDWLTNVLDPADMPRKGDVTSAVKAMSDLARDQIRGEAVIDWNPHLEILHVVDPFFAYHLKWHADFQRRCGTRFHKLAVRR